MDNNLFDSQGRMEILDGMRYIYSKTDDCSFCPKFEVTMKEPVDISFLQMAAEMAMERYRPFRLIVTEEEETFYLKENHRLPVVHVIDDEKRHVLGTEENNGYLIWIGTKGCRIVLEFFHGLTDARGFLAFVKLLLRQYVALRYKITIKEMCPQEDPSECVDSMHYVDETRNYPVQEQRRFNTFQIPEDQIAADQPCNLYRLQLDAEEFDAYMRKNHSSRTAMFATFMNHAIDSIHTQKKCSIVAAVAADVRKIYGAESTLRDCTDMLPVYLNSEMRLLPMSQQLALARQMIVDAMQPEARLSFASKIKLSNQVMHKRMTTLSAKKRFSRQAHQLSFIQYTYTLSNVGCISFGEESDAYVENFELTMNANSFPISMEIVQYGNYYNVMYCTRIINDPYVHKFQKMFIDVGIPCECEYRGDSAESLVVF